MDFMVTEFTGEKRARVFSSNFATDTATLLNGRGSSEEATAAGRGASPMPADVTTLPPETDDGNVEYKEKLCNLSNERINHLTTQMKWRLREGQGEAIYEIGVADNGSLIGITQADMSESLGVLEAIAQSINASFNVLSQREVTSPTNEKRFVTEVLIRRVPDDQPFIQIRCAVLGTAEAGKSTLCGVLACGYPDNGKGSARLNILRYLHEIQSGKTSSICLDVIGFSSDGQLLNRKKNSLDEVIEKSTKLMTLIDLAGDRKYIGTTIYGLSGYNPHYCAILVSATKGPTSITKEHACLAMALNIPTFVLVTKTDAVSATQLQTVISKCNTLVKTVGLSAGCQVMRSTDQAVSAATSLSKGQGLTPLLAISNVTGTNFDLLQCFLHILPPVMTLSRKERDALNQKPPFFQIEEVFDVPCVGSVVCGILTEGILEVGDGVKIGPNRMGEYAYGRIGSIRRNKQPVFSLHPGAAASVAVTFSGTPPAVINRGMIMIDESAVERSCWEFETKFFLFYHPGGVIEEGFQGTVYIGSLRRTALIVGIQSSDKSSKIKPCSWVNVRFRFYGKPEFVQIGAPLIFRESKTRAMGQVTHVIDEFVYLPESKDTTSSSSKPSPSSD